MVPQGSGWGYVLSGNSGATGFGSALRVLREPGMHWRSQWHTTRKPNRGYSLVIGALACRKGLLNEVHDVRIAAGLLRALGQVF